MQISSVLPRYMEALLGGDRAGAREIVRRLLSTGGKAEAIYRDLLVPAMKKIQAMHRSDELTTLVEHVATRINRFITDQVQAQLIPHAPNGKSAVVICGEAESEELGGQVCADILEARGWKTYFLGGGVAEDELIELIGTEKPELLAVYGSTPSGVPKIREIIERIRDIGASPLMNVVVTGGIFDRVEGLWQEVQADFYAPDPVSVAETAQEAPHRLHSPKDPQAPKRRRRLVSQEPIAALV